MLNTNQSIRQSINLSQAILVDQVDLGTTGPVTLTYSETVHLLCSMLPRALLFVACCGV